MYNWNDIVKFIQVADAAKDGFIKMNELEQQIRNINAWQQKINDWYNEVLQSNKYQYGRLWSSLKAYLAAEGKIVPVDEMDFFDWLLDVRYPDLQIGEPLPKIERSDFILFHQYHDTEIKAKTEIASTPVTPEIENNPVKLSIAGYAILHVYFAKYGGQPITKQNQDTIANQYGFSAKSSGKHLYDAYIKYKADNERVNINTTNKKAAKEHIARFQIIMPLLKAKSLNAFNQAQKDFKQIEQLYNKYHQ